MFKDLDRQTVIGLALAVVVAAAAIFLVVAQKQNGGLGGIISGESGGPVNILNDQLTDKLSIKKQGLLTTSTGQGSLPGGVGWSFSQSSASSGGNFIDNNGNSHSEEVVAEGSGSKLVLSGVKDVSSGQDALRRSLSDENVDLTAKGPKLVLSSKYLIASEPVLQNGKLTLSGLFLRERCRNPNFAADPLVKTNCRITLSN